MASKGSDTSKAPKAAPVDFFGREIKVGDTILYPSTVASLSAMNVAEVKEIVVVATWMEDMTKLKVRKIGDSFRGGHKNDVALTIECLDRVVVYNHGGVK